MHRISYPVLLSALLALNGTAHAQDGNAPSTSGAAAETANRIVDKKGIGLTPAQAETIVQGVASEKMQTVPESAITIGSPVPDSLTLVELPVEVKDQIGSLRDFKIARLQNDAILIVDPTSRVVVDIVRK